MGKGKPAVFEVQYEGHYFTNQVVPVFNNDEIEQLIIISTDNTDKKKAEELEKDLFNKLEKEVEKRVQELNEQTSKLKASQQALTFLLEDVNAAREELLETNKKLEAANNDLEAFAYSVSHDLRAPLRHIDGFTRLLENKLEEDPAGAETYFTKIHTASNRMHNLIDDLLTFSRLGRKKVKFLEIDINELVTDIIHSYEPDFKNRDLNWKVDELPVIQGDPELLKIAFDNLISNAIKFTSKRDKATISLYSNQPDDNMVNIIIEDNGVGFDMTYVHKIFGVFERLHSLNDFPGTGIGLANVKRVIQSHNGKISAESEISKGAKFILSLPVNN